MNNFLKTLKIRSYLIINLVHFKTLFNFNSENHFIKFKTSLIEILLQNILKSY